MIKDFVNINLYSYKTFIFCVNFVIKYVWLSFLASTLICKFYFKIDIKSEICKKINIINLNLGLFLFSTSKCKINDKTTHHFEKKKNNKTKFFVHISVKGK